MEINKNIEAMNEFKKHVVLIQNELQRDKYRPFKDTDEFVRYWEEHYKKFQEFYFKEHVGILVNDINGVHECWICASENGIGMEMQDLFDCYKFFDNHPCGIEIDDVQ